MATSLTSPALVFAADKAIIAARKALAKAALFSTDFSADAVQPGTTLLVPIFSGAAAQYDESSNDYENADGSVAWVPITFDQHPKSTFKFSDKDFTLANGSSFWANAGKASGEAVAEAIVSAISGLVTTTAVTGTATAATITKANIAKLRASCATAGADPGRCVVMLQPAQFADLLALLDSNVFGGSEAIRQGIVPGLYGFKAVVENADLPTEGNTVGAVIPEDALVIAGRTLPVASPKAYEEIGSTTDEASGLVLGVRRHGAPKTGSNYMTIEALFGAALAQAGKCLRIVTA